MDELSKLSVMSKNGDEWRKQRTTLSPTFHFDFLIDISPIFHQKAVLLLKEWEKQESLTIDIKPWVTKYALDVLGCAVFGVDFDTLRGGSSEYEQAHLRVMDWFGWMGLLNLIPGLLKTKFLFKDLYGLITNIQKMTLDIVNKKLEDRKNNPKFDKSKGDLLDGMLNHLSDLGMDEIVSNVWLFFIAGHETTSTTISWAMHYFAKFPELQTIAREEVDRVLESKVPNHENVKGLIFLDLFIKEVMRFSAPVQLLPFARHPTKDVVIDGHVIPKNTSVNVAVDVIHHLEEFWPEPEKFDPYRFTPENSKHRHPYAYLPFSIGRRHCIANNFAMMEMRIFLAELLQKFTIEYVEEPKIMYVIFADSPRSVNVTLKHRSLG